MQALGAARAGALPHGAGTGRVVVGGEGRQGMPRPVPLYYMRMLLERTQHATCMEAGAMSKAAGDVAERMRKVALLDGGSNDATVMVVNTGGGRSWLGSGSRRRTNGSAATRACRSEWLLRFQRKGFAKLRTGARSGKPGMLSEVSMCILPPGGGGNGQGWGGKRWRRGSGNSSGG